MSIRNYMTVEITDAAVTQFLHNINQLDIDVSEVRFISELTASVKIHGNHLNRLKLYADRYGADLKVIESKGLLDRIRRLVHRPILCIGVLIWMFLVLYLPTRVLFVEVIGNENIATTRILESAEMCGIRFGASRRFVRSEKVKNKLLSNIPQLQWTGVNTYGCIAVITVKERTLTQSLNNISGVGNIVASCDGVITSILVTKGTVKCHAGQGVRKGQILISGYTDCGLVTQSTIAGGEVRALTNRSITALAPSMIHKNSQPKKKKVYYSVQIGKNIIKLHKNSGICGVGCVKMNKQLPLTLPGGFKLPFALVETTVIYSDDAKDIVNTTDPHYVSVAVRKMLLERMLAGKIVKEYLHYENNNGIGCFTGVYVCDEMIGKLRMEEHFKKYG